MSWTTPKTWEVLEQLTADKMNEQVRDNLDYLKSTIDDLTKIHLIAHNWEPTGTNDMTQSTTYVDTSFSFDVTTTATCTLLIWIWWKQGISGSDGAALSYTRLYQNSTLLLEYYTSSGNGPTGRMAYSAKQTPVAPGTYTFKFQHKISDALQSSRFLDGQAFIIALEE